MPEAPTPLTKRERILTGLDEQNKPATFGGREGFWCQGDCVFIDGAMSPQQAIAWYRQDLDASKIAISHNHFCGEILRAKDLNKIAELEQATASQAAEIAQQARTIAELRAQIDVLMNGDAIIVPKTIQHARAMYRAAVDALAEFEGQAGDGKEGA